LGRSSTPGRRRPGAARPTSPRPAGHAAAPTGAPPLGAATQSRLWQDLELRPLADATEARPLFDFAAIPWPAPSGVAFGWGAAPATGGALVAALLAERAGRAVLLHGPIVAFDGGGASSTSATDPLQVAAQLVTAAIEHAAALGADTAFARPQGLDRVWIRFGFIPVPESTLPAAFAGRPGAGLYGWRGGSALWTLRDAGEASAA
jgi:hypothetical protein